MNSQDFLTQYEAGKRDFSRENLAGIDLDGKILRNVDFSDADLSGANLSGADLRRTTLDGANLSGANLQNADLKRSSLFGANLSSADLRGADLTQAAVEDPDRKLLILENAIYDQTTQFPEGFSPRSLGARLPTEIIPKTANYPPKKLVPRVKVNDPDVIEPTLERQSLPTARSETSVQINTDQINTETQLSSPESSQTYRPDPKTIPLSPVSPSTLAKTGLTGFQRLLVVLVGVFAFYFSLYSCTALVFRLPQPGDKADQDTSTEPIAWQPTCGSPTGSGSTWWPVKSSAAALDVARHSYCGDAYINTNGETQVASFTSRDQAEQFAQLLSRRSGFRFWVGEPTQR